MSLHAKRTCARVITGAHELATQCPPGGSYGNNKYTCMCICSSHYSVDSVD